MSVIDIFSDINKHMVDGIRMHCHLADYFDFLGMGGFKRQQEYRYFDESIELRAIRRYFINHYGMVLEERNSTEERYIPSAWSGVDRMNVDNSARSKAIKESIETWVKWETDTKKMYQDYYSQLCDMHEIAGAKKVMCLICGVDKELKCAQRLWIKLKCLDFNVGEMALLQDEMHEKYRKKMNKLGVKMC